MAASVVKTQARGSSAPSRASQQLSAQTVESDDSLSNRRFWTFLLVWGLVALALRLFHTLSIRDALGSAQIHDAAYYHEVALGMLRGQQPPGLESEIAFANLGYPYWLKGLYMLGASPNSVLVVQAFLGSATCVLLGVFAQDLFRKKQVGLWAAGLAALYAPAIFYDAQLLIPSLSAFLTTVLAWSLLRSIRFCSWQTALMAGFAIGLATLLRASHLLLLPFSLAALYSVQRSEAGRSIKPQALALVLATFICTGPVVVHQGLKTGAWVPLTANGGLNFWIGNHRGATGKYENAPFLGHSQGGDFQHTIVRERKGYLKEAAKRADDPQLSLVDAGRFWWREAGREIASSPGRWLVLLSRKLHLSTNNHETTTNASFGFIEQVSPILAWNPFRFGGLLVLATVGWLHLSRGQFFRARILLASLLLPSAVTCLLFFMSGEYRHPATPALIVLAAGGVWAMQSSIVQALAGTRSLRWRWALVPLFVASLAFSPLELSGVQADRKTYAEALATPSLDGTPPTLKSYQLARRLLSEAKGSVEESLLAKEASLLVESNRAIQFRDLGAAARLIEASHQLWLQELRPQSAVSIATVERIRGNQLRRVQQLCRQPFVEGWKEIKRDLLLLGCHSWQEVAVLLSQNKKAEARTLLAEAAQQAPHATELLAYRAQLELSEGKNGQPWLDRSLAGYPRRAQPALLMAQTSLAAKDGALARKSVEDALLREPTNERAKILKLALTAINRPDLFANAAPLIRKSAHVLAQEGMAGLGIELLKSAVHEGPYDEAQRYALGDLMFRAAPPNKLLRFFRSQLKRDPKPQTSHYFIALALEKQGNNKQAIDELQRALKIDPAHEMSQRRWAHILEAEGRLEEALEHFEEATRIHPEFQGALHDLARLNERLGRREQAEAWRQRAKNADPNSPQRFVYWARYLHHHGHHSAALTEVERRLTVAPEDKNALVLKKRILRALSSQG